MQQVPAIQARLDGLMLQVGDVSQRVAMLSNQVVETQSQLEMVSDRQDGLHFAIIEIGGFVRYHDLTARERSSMFTQERGKHDGPEHHGGQPILESPSSSVKGICKRR